MCVLGLYMLVQGTYIYVYIFVFRSPKAFGDTCERTKTSDDLTVGAIIGISYVTLC